MSEAPSQRAPLVHYLDETDAISCPYGKARRVVTGGEGGVANIHVIRVTRGTPHIHRGYDEVYFVLAGRGRICLDGRYSDLRPGAVAVIPAGTVHSIEAEDDDPVEFLIFGVPPVPIEDERAWPASPLNSRPS